MENGIFEINGKKYCRGRVILTPTNKEKKNGDIVKTFTKVENALPSIGIIDNFTIKYNHDSFISHYMYITTFEKIKVNDMVINHTLLGIIGNSQPKRVSEIIENNIILEDREITSQNYVSKIVATDNPNLQKFVGSYNDNRGDIYESFPKLSNYFIQTYVACAGWSFVGVFIELKEDFILINPDRTINIRGAENPGIIQSVTIASVIVPRMREVRINKLLEDFANHIVNDIRFKGIEGFNINKRIKKFLKERNKQ